VAKFGGGECEVRCVRACIICLRIAIDLVKFLRMRILSGLCATPKIVLQANAGVFVMQWLK